MNINNNTNSFQTDATQLQSQTNPPKLDSTRTKDSGKVSESLGKMGDTAHRTGVTLTGVLPFSSRGMIANALLLPVRMVQNAGPGFTQKMKDHIDKDWHGGIDDSYKDLRGAKNKDLREKVVSENSSYAAYIYKGIEKSVYGHHSPEGGDDGDLISENSAIIKGSMPEEHREALNTVKDRLKEMGFKDDGEGNYYSTKTGTVLNVIYDYEKKEVVVAFMGLSAEQYLKNITSEEKSSLKWQSNLAVAGDWFGGIPAASRQAIEIGKMLKEVTGDKGPTPVVIGHSHGGGLAQTAAASSGIKGVAFNSRPMGAGTRRYIGQSTVAKNASNITVFSGKGDFLSGFTTLNRVAAGFERLTGIPVPRSVGTGYRLPPLQPIVDKDGKEHARDVGAKHFRFHEAFTELKYMNDE